MPKPTAIVTGGAGFIGSHLVDALIADGATVVVIDDLSSGEAGRVTDEASLEVVDIADRSHLDRVVDVARPSVVYHLAAQSSVTRSVADPELDCRSNVLGTLNVLEAATHHSANVVFSSTGGALYGNRALLPTAEDSIPAPISPYGASKWAGEAYVTTWREATRLPHAVCRLGNIYGARQSPHGEAGVAAIFSHQLWRGEAPTLYGHGEATRDYVHVHDVARALIAAASAPGTFNISTGVETPVSRIFDVLQDEAGTALQPLVAPLRAGELERSCLDPSRAGRELHWRAEIGLEDGLRSTFHALVEEFESAGSSDAG
jgi:UDP-glucose 4-epimerase